MRVAIARHKKKPRVQPTHGGQNKILSEAQSEAVIQYIRYRAETRLGATKQMIFAAICHLKAAEEPSKPFLSRRWFQSWLKAHSSLHTIKTKPIASDRVIMHDEKVIVEWFQKGRKIRKGKNIHNFDESGIRVGCPRGEEIVVPIDCKEKCTRSPENRQSLSIIESISADGLKPPPAIIVPGKRIMDSWIHDNLKGDELILLSDTGYK